MHGVDTREHRMSGVRIDTGTQAYDLDDYPATERIMDAGGAFTVHVDDPGADPAERDLLLELGVTSVVAVAVPSADGCWLVEIYGDDDTLDARAAEPYLRLLAGEAARAKRRFDWHPAPASGQAGARP
jgi:hypothetical protein